MSKRYPNPRLVKINHSYTVEDIAILFGTQKNRVRGWVKAGLTILDKRRPMLISGQDLAAFIRACRAKNKQTCKPGELYCVRCRAPRFPAAGMADYSPVTEKFGNLKAICPVCDSIMNLRVSLANLGQVREKMDIHFPQALEHLIESNKPTVNSDLRQER